MILYEMLRKSAEDYPDKCALIYQNTKISYRMLIHIVDSLQCGFIKLGINSHERVGLVLHNSIDFVVCLYALSKNENIVCLLNPQYSVEEIEEKANSAFLDKLIAERYIHEKILEKNKTSNNCFSIILKDECVEMHTLDLEEQYGMQKDYLDENSVALIQCTSGTSAKPKMAYRTHRNLDIDSINIIETMNYKEEDVIAVPVPMCHGYGLTMGLIAPIRAGATVYIQRWFECNQFFKRYKEIKPTIFIGVPEIYDCICSELKMRPYKFIHNKWFLCSGSPLSKETGENFYKVSGVWLSQIYGMMEVSTICANLNSNNENYLSVGHPVNGVKIKLVKTGKEMQYRILVSGETVSKQYVTTGGVSAITDSEGWFNTRDVGYVYNSNIYLLGREEVNEY